MKNLKLLLLTLLSTLSFNLFSQTQVYTTNTSGPNICDGTAVLDTTNINMTSIYWQGMGMIINQGSYMVTNLCPGTYGVTFISNGTSVTLTFIIMSGNFNPCLNFGGFLTPTNSVDSTTCDGSATVTVTGGQAPYTYQWSNGSTTQTINSLCPGVYCCYVSDMNGCWANICDTIGVQSPNAGDTLIINGSLCPNPQGTIVTQIENCQFNYNSAYIAYLTSVTIPTNPMDSMIIYWTFIDTTAAMTYIQYNVPQINISGCYNFTLILHCSIKSFNIKTIIVNDSYNVTLLGINELTENRKQLIHVVDMLGRETKVTNNQPLIYVYSDGTREIKYITE
jgi:hypothetical protein